MGQPGKRHFLLRGLHQPALSNPSPHGAVPQPSQGLVVASPVAVLLRCDSELQSQLQERLADANANRSLQSVWQCLGYQQLAPTHMDCLLNCNDPASFALLQSIWIRRHTLQEPLNVE